MQKRGCKELYFIVIFILISLAILIILSTIYQKGIGISRSPSTPPTFHEFYGSVKCLNGQQIVNGHNIIGKINSLDYTTTIVNGNYHLFVEDGNNGQLIDFCVDNEDISDENYLSFGFTQKNIFIDDIYCTTNPVISINNPRNNQEIQQNNVDIIFTNLNFIIGSIGEPHLHIYKDSDTIPYMFYNGNSNIIYYNSVPASGIERLNINSFRLIGLSNGSHTIRLVLSDQFHTELMNSGASDSVSFSVNLQVTGGGSSGGGGGGGGGGGSSRRYQCNDNLDNDNDAKIDYPNDPGCISKIDDSEVNSVNIISRCNDNLDNDNDGLIDLNDPECTNAQDNSEDNILINETRDDSKIELPTAPSINDNGFKKIWTVITSFLILAFLLVIFIIIFIMPKLNKKRYN